MRKRGGGGCGGGRGGGGYLNSAGDVLDAAPECAKNNAAVIRFAATKTHMQVVDKPASESEVM
jgi:hypothetical protein